MRIAQPHFITVALALMTGCFLVPEANHTNERAVCERYLDCVTTVTPEAAGAAVVLYGEDSACWASSTDAERCAVACEEALDDVAVAFPYEAECQLDGIAPPTPSLSSEPMDWMMYLTDIPESECNLSQFFFPDGQPMFTSPTGSDTFDFRFDGWQEALPCTRDGQDFLCDLGPNPENSEPHNLSGTSDATLSELTVSWPLYIGAQYCGELGFVAERR